MAYRATKFYRNLDELLHEIDYGAEGSGRMLRILELIVDRFGDELAIENGRLYHEEADGFRLDQACRPRAENVEGLLVPRGYPPLELVLEHKTFIFDAETEGQEGELEDKLGGKESVAILINGEPRRLMAFGLRESWEREQLSFSMNIIRHAIDQRLLLEHLKTDIDQAAEIQASLLPEEPPDFPGFTMAVRTKAYSAAGGDFVDFLQDDPASLVFAVGDAAGHNLGSALLARDVVTGLRMAYERDLKITSVIDRLNRVVAQNSLSSRFVSLFFAEIEDNGDLFYVNAGHPPPIILGARGRRDLRQGGPILGPMKTAKYKRGYACLDPGDTLVVLTDGMLEREDADGNDFGEERVVEVVSPLVGQDASLILDRIFEAVADFGRGRVWNDDRTVLVISRHADS